MEITQHGDTAKNNIPLACHVTFLTFTWKVTSSHSAIVFTVPLKGVQIITLKITWAWTSFFDSLLHTWAVIWSLSTTYCPIPVMRSVSLSAVLWMFSLYRAWSHENITAPSGSSGIDRVMGVRKSWFSTVLTWPPTPPFHPLFQPHGLSFLSPHHFPLHLFQQQTLYQEFSSGNMKKETDS